MNYDTTKKALVQLLNSIFSNMGEYRIEYDYDDTGILVNVVDPDNLLPIISKRLLIEQVYRNVRRASKYIPDAMTVYNDLDFEYSYNGEPFNTSTINDVRISQPVLDCFNTTIEYINDNDVKLNTAFINVGPAMGEYKVILSNNTILSTDIDANEAYLNFYIYVLPDYIILTNEKGQSVKVTPEDIKEFISNGGDDGEPYPSTEKEMIDSILSSTSFAMQEQDEQGTIIPDFYNCIYQYVNWDEGLYEDYYPKFEILVNGISKQTTSYGHWKETNQHDFERVNDLFNFLLRK
jgi:hypothetical protein